MWAPKVVAADGRHERSRNQLGAGSARGPWDGRSTASRKQRSDPPRKTPFWYLRLTDDKRTFLTFERRPWANSCSRPMLFPRPLCSLGELWRVGESVKLLPILWAAGSVVSAACSFRMTTSGGNVPTVAMCSAVTQGSGPSETTKTTRQRLTVRGLTHTAGERLEGTESEQQPRDFPSAAKKLQLFSGGWSGENSGRTRVIVQLLGPRWVPSRS